MEAHPDHFFGVVIRAGKHAEQGKNIVKLIGAVVSDCV
jgi:hypothetical protein